MKRVLWGLLAVGMFSMIMSCSDTSTGTGTSNESFGHLRMKITNIDPDHYDVHGVLVKVFPESLPDSQKDCLTSSTNIQDYQDLMWIPQPISDSIFVLASGYYKVCSIPRDSNGYQSTVCGVAVQRNVKVEAQYVTEVTLESLCNANGGLDVITTFKDEPLITGLTLDYPPGKFITTCESAKMHVTADQTNAPLSYNWTFKPMPPPPSPPLFAKIDFINGDATFTSNYVPPYDPNYKDNVFEITVTVTDNIGNTSSMTFPIHVRKCHPIYLGGSFTNANSPPQIRNRAAAVDPVYGTVIDAWNPDLDGTVNALLLSDSVVYLGGVFQKANSPATSRNHAAAVDDIFGTIVPTSCDPGIGNTVDTLGIHMVVNSNEIYVGGEFTSVNGGTSVDRVAAFDPSLCTVNTSWIPTNQGNNVYTIGFYNDNVYLGGAFLPNHAIAVKDTDGSLDPNWVPSVDGDVYALAVSGQTVYLGGAFNTINGNPHKFAGAVDAINGADTGWSPQLVGNAVKAMAIDGSNIYLGGDFHMAGGTHYYVAKFDTTNGTVDPNWNPILDGSVNSIVVCNGAVYLGGNFTNVNTNTRNRAAAVTADDATLLDWDPNLSNEVRAMAMNCPSYYSQY